jgi:alkylation response protein AidB-like acyl-CoA dehydrogenase
MIKLEPALGRLEEHGAQLAESCLERARSVAPVLAAAHDRIDDERKLTDDVLQAMHGAGLFRMTLPRALGGGEVSPPVLAQMTEIIAKADASAGWCLGQGSGCAMSAAFMDPEPARQVFGSDNAVLAWGAGQVGKAVACQGGYRVTGSWQFASGSKHATRLGGHCKVFEADGSPRINKDGRQADRTALFPRAVAQMHDDWHVMGLKGTRSEGYTVTDLSVVAPLTLDRDDQAECRSEAPLYVFPTTLVYASCFSGLALGIGRGALDDLITLANTKTQRSARSSMADSPVFHTQIAELEAQWGAARAYQQSTLQEVWEIVCETGALSVENRARIRLAATYAINQTTDVVQRVYRLAGSSAIFEKAPFERRFRDMHAVSQQMQARQSHYETVGRQIMGLDSNSPHM